MAIEKYIIDKSDLTALLRGEDLAIQPKGNIKGFCVEIAGDLTNGDMIKAAFPEVNFYDMAFTVHAAAEVTSNGVKGGISYDFWKDWWNAPYKTESEKV